MDPDLPLVERWKRGDDAAFGELYDRHFRAVFRFLDGKVGAPAEDLVHDTFAECMGARKNFRLAASFRTFLFKIAKHVLFHHFRSARKDDRIDFDVSSLSQLAAPVTSPGTRVDRARRAREVRQALAQLSLSDQILVEFHFWNDLDAGALATIFDVPDGTVRVRLHRALKRLKPILDATDTDARDDPFVNELWPAQKRRFLKLVRNPELVTNDALMALPQRSRSRPPKEPSP